MRRIGVDPGSRRTGLALSEPDVRVAYPFKTVEHTGLDEAARLVADEVRSANAQEVVVGLPLRTDGVEGEAARNVRRFAALLEELTAVPVVLWDERLSTAAAHKHLSDSNVHGKKRRKVVDQAAATLILQSYLDSIGKSPWEEELTLENAPPGKADRRRDRGAGGKRWRDRSK
jgi:putative holliday junction resolvase